MDTNKQFVIGQGVRHDFAEKILENKKNNNYNNKELDLENIQKFVCYEKNKYSHKRIPHNTIIGSTRKENENSFSLPLLIDERCELMSDHQTGQHIQGMILIEACRQTFIAVTEEFFYVRKNRTVLLCYQWNGYRIL
ncbi:AfsA-related hotdog domain-containing protein [Xenorhabdus nematophila]|uniref:AfsA-related hotdog domain-containing protein n=1 Tax=Xenorhabdus nematophila TaxID=628 RepID=UPI001F24D54B|nr:AfsA-related hotdog domain-containing protein [Xenorhabdus nematophila]